MKLSRVAARRKEARSFAFEQREPGLSVDSSSGEIILLVRSADCFNSPGLYDYTVTLSSSDIVAIFELIASGDHAFRPGGLNSAIVRSAVPLIRLLSAAASIPQSSSFAIPENSED